MTDRLVSFGIAVAIATLLTSCTRKNASTGMRITFVAPRPGALVSRTVPVAIDVVGGVDPITVTFGGPEVAPVVVNAAPYHAAVTLLAEAGTTVTLGATATDSRGTQATASVSITIDPGAPPPPDAGAGPDAPEERDAATDTAEADGASADTAPPDTTPAWLGPPGGVEFVIRGAPAHDWQGDPAAVWDGVNTFVAWADRRDPQRPGIFGARVARDGSVLDPTGVPLAPGSEPGLAWNGTIHLLVNRDQPDASTSRYVARRLARDGTPLDREPVVLTMKPSGSIRPSAASNGNGFLVAWVDERNTPWARIYFARIDAGGRLLDPEGVRLTLDANPDGLTGLSVSWTGQNYLVTYVDQWGVRGGWISPEGHIAPPGAIQLSQTYFVHRLPAASFDGTNHLVAWYEKTLDQQPALFAALASPALGATNVGRIAIGRAGDPAPQGKPLLAWAGTHHVFAWQDELEGTHSARLSSAGALLDPAPFAGPRAGGSPVLVGDGGGLLLVGTATDTGGTDVVGWRMRPDARFEAADPVRIGLAGASQRAGALAWNGTRYLAVWIDHRHPEAQIQHQLLDEAGRTLSSESSALAGGAIVQTTPPALGTDNKDFLVVWEEAPSGSTGDLRGSMMDGGGSTAGAKEFAIAVGPGRQTSPAVVWTGAHYLVAWVDDRTDANGAQHLRGTRITSAGLSMDGDGLRLAPTSGAKSVALAGGREGLLMVWQEGAAGRVRARRLSVDGAPEGLPFAIADTAGRQEAPTVAWSGTDYLVAWSEARDATKPADLYGARVSAAGVVRDGAGGFIIAAAAQAQRAPRATWNGTNFVVAWRDERQSTGAGIPLVDVYAARVSPAGQVLDPGGFALAASDQYEDAPALAGRGGGVTLALWQQYDSAPSVRAVRMTARLLGEKTVALPAPREENEACAAHWQCRFGTCIQGGCCATCDVPGGPDAGATP